MWIRYRMDRNSVSGDLHMRAKVFRRAAELVAQGWCQGALVRDAEGNDLGCDVLHPHAAAWCAGGAILRARSELRLPEGTSMFIFRCDDPRTWPRWNDAPDRTAEEVEMALLRSAADRDHAAEEAAGLCTPDPLI